MTGTRHDKQHEDEREGLSHRRRHRFDGRRRIHVQCLRGGKSAKGSKNFAFISQFVEIADDCVFTVEYSFEALIKAFK